MSVVFEDFVVEASPFPASRLSWPGASAEELAFMRTVYQINVNRSSARGTFVDDIPDDELLVIESGHKAKKKAAEACLSLLAAARAAIETAAVKVEIGVVSGYRSASTQLRLWQGYFPNYYKDTISQRQEMSGGAHGSAAAQWMAGYVGGRIATPGFSNHQNGIAIDFLNKEDGRQLANSTKKPATKAWRQTWFWTWLTNNANRFGFYQNTNIDEPWHWEFKGIPAQQEWEDNYLAAPALMAPQREYSPAIESIYVKIPLGLGKEWADRDKTVQFNTEAKTGIYIPSNFNASNEAGLLLFLHGHKSVALGKDKSVDGYWNASRFPHFAFREFLNDSGSNLVLAVPTLGPLSQAGNLTSDAGFTNFITKVIAAINEHCSQHLNGKSFSPSYLILACHSGGGSPMLRIAQLADKNYYAGLIKEFWGFDSMYGDYDAEQWKSWAAANPQKKVYQYYIGGSRTAREGDQLKKAVGKEGLTNIFAIVSTDNRHDWVPAQYFVNRLTGLQQTSMKTEWFHEDECCCGEELAEYDDDENTIVFPSGNSLAVVTGEDDPGEEYYDPNQSGNPLLDTSGANQDIMLSKNIKVSEMARSGGKNFDKARIDVQLIKCLQAVRDKTGKPLKINSGYRSYGYNKQLQQKSSNVAKKSQHMSGRAADVRIDGLNGLEIAKAALDAYSCNIGVGLAPDFAHLDVRGKFEVWRYSGDPASMDDQVKQLREYRKKCVNGAAKTSGEQRVTGVAQILTGWTAETEKKLKEQFGGSPRNLSRQNEFNDALYAAQSEWDQLDPFILKSLLAQESSFNSKAVNTLGFAGIAQLGMLEAKSVGLSTGASREQTSRHRRREETYLREYFDFEGDERFDATKAIIGAAKLLKKKWQSLNKMVFQVTGYPEGDDLHRFVLGAYNGGEGTVKKRVDRVYGPVCMARIRFDEMGAGEWIKYANIIVSRARQ